ncbi:fused MFS/spermidine synthase [Nocardioides sp. P86]|uniref:spermidine synthase n=1 Tax=Nocardioides sp. P86 TaxID=2939569 RepID=UPI00203F7FF7|nr:fused MFS/spermidine synthase [Nocardioides sp. P86]MCM3515187.1 fused MFS/spermidine synthase [Nocardioides sp. P86]
MGSQAPSGEPAGVAEATEPAEVVATERARGFVVRVGGRDQSHVDLDDPTRLEFGYVRRMGDVVDAHGGPGAPLRVVHVGGAGLTLPRYVAHTRPRSSQVVLEPDTALTALVRERLPLPRRSGIKVRPVDGRTGLAELREGSFDLVVLDAYAAGRVPADLVTPAAFALVARALAPDGLALLNLSDRTPFAHTRDVLAGLRVHLPHLTLSAEPPTLKGRRAGNLVVVAGRAAEHLAGGDRALARGAVSAATPYVVLDAVGVASGFGGGTPLPEPPAPGGRPEG